MMKYAIHYSTRMKDVILFSFVISIILFQVATLTQYSYPVLFYMQMAVNVVVVAALAIEGYARLVKREVNIQENSDTISINGVEIHADQIREIKVSGCHKAAFQINLKNKNVNPMYSALNLKRRIVKEFGVSRVGPSGTRFPCVRSDRKPVPGWYSHQTTS